MTKTPTPRRPRTARATAKRAPVRSPTAGRTCGDFGGRNADGTPCDRLPGWGVPLEKVAEAPGLCRDHHPAHESMIRSAKQAFIELLATGKPSLELAARKGAQVDVSTIWLWRKQDQTFNEGVELALATNRAIRCAELEDSAFIRAVRGEAAAALEIFLLKNYSQGRLKDRHELTGAEGTPLLPVETIQKILSEG